MQGYICKVCGFISIDGNAPDKCPVCGAPKTAFENKLDAIKLPGDSKNLTEPDKKHIPQIVIVKKCGLIPGGGCVDAHVKVGEIQHPMTTEHFIMNIDFYIDKKYISRIMLTPDKCNPAGALHLKANSGKLTAISLCNIHGAWISEAEI